MEFQTCQCLIIKWKNCLDSDINAYFGKKSCFIKQMVFVEMWPEMQFLQWMKTTQNLFLFSSTDISCIHYPWTASVLLSKMAQSVTQAQSRICSCYCYAMPGWWKGIATTFNKKMNNNIRDTPTPQKLYLQNSSLPCTPKTA